MPPARSAPRSAFPARPWRRVMPVDVHGRLRFTPWAPRRLRVLREVEQVAKELQAENRPRITDKQPYDKVQK
jgi:hypothetical protein